MEHKVFLSDFLFFELKSVFCSICISNGRQKRKPYLLRKLVKNTRSLDLKENISHGLHELTGNKGIMNWKPFILQRLRRLQRQLFPDWVDTII